MTLGKFFGKSIIVMLGIILIVFLLEQNNNRRNHDQTTSQANKDSEANLKIKNGHFIEVEDNQVVWQIQAAQARLFEDKNYASLEEIKALRVLDNGQKVQLEGKSGNFRMDTRDLSLHGQIKIVTDSQIRFTTESLQWNNREQKIYSDDWVCVEREGIRLVGKGMETDDQLNKVLLKEHVTTYFN